MPFTVFALCGPILLAICVLDASCYFALALFFAFSHNLDSNPHIKDHKLLSERP